jgi:hypothetical protein
VVYAPGHLIYQLTAATFEIPSSGILSILLLNLVDLVLSSLAIPAIVHGLLRGPAMRPPSPGDGANGCEPWASKYWSMSP